MPKKLLFLSAAIFLLLASAGCGTGGSGVHVRTYIEEKERVDQELTGNAGFLTGSSEEETKDKKNTRKVYVLEFSKEAESTLKETTTQQPSTMSGSSEAMTSYGYKSNMMGDSSDREMTFPTETASASQFVEYKVEKDDTLQKIAKKFYNSYSKWPKIYEANKDKIKDPDHIKPGIVLNVPVE